MILILATIYLTQLLLCVTMIMIEKDIANKDNKKYVVDYEILIPFYGIYKKIIND